MFPWNAFNVVLGGIDIIALLGLDAAFYVH
jgi:hypothetical protein